jgi:polyhydroxybutyrate depolymerase
MCEVFTDMQAHELNLDVGGQPRKALVVEPSNIRDGAAVVLAFHGSNQTAAGFHKAIGGSLDGLVAGGDAVVVYLDGYRGNWNDARRDSDFPSRRDGIDDVSFSRAVVDQLVGPSKVDRNRVIGLGYSAGGQMVIRLIHHAPELLAGAVIVSATQPVSDNFVASEEVPVPIPVVLIHGTRDRLVPFGGGMASLWGFRPRGLGLSAPETAAYFSNRNGITAQPVTTTLHHVPKSHKTSVHRTDFRQDGHPPVVLFSVEGGGHVVPNPRPYPMIMGRTTHDIDIATVVGETSGLERTNSGAFRRVQTRSARRSPAR